MNGSRFDEDAFDENGVAKDGRGVSVRMHMLDGLDPIQRAIAGNSVSDAQRRTAWEQKGALLLDSRNPAFASCRSEGLAIGNADSRVAAYDAHSRHLKDAWRSSGATQTDRSSDHRQTADGGKGREAAYAAWGARLGNAWRGAP